MDRKRRHSVSVKDVIVSKLSHKNDSEISSDLLDEGKPDELNNTCQTKKYIPRQLIELMYQSDLSVLCYLRCFRYKHKYPSLSLEFKCCENTKFSNIVLSFENKSIHIQIENVDKYYVDNCISYGKLFIREKEKRCFFINDYFDNFTKHLINDIYDSLSSIQYLIIYTNVALGLTEENKLRKGRSWTFYPFEFDSIKLKECNILFDFLHTHEEGRVFYQFSKDETTREELLKRLQFSPSMKKIIEDKNISQNEIKEGFIGKLIFAVNQPNREQLNSIIKNEIKKKSGLQDGYIALQEIILQDLTSPERPGDYVAGIMYELNLVMIFIHNMFLDRNLFFINFEEKGYSISSGISVNYKGRISYIKAYNADSNIGYSQLFPSSKAINTFSIDKHFAIFTAGLTNDVRYFIIYTNADLDLSEENKLKKSRSKGFYPFRLENIDVQKKKYKIFRNCSCINTNGLYRFLQEEAIKLSSLLTLPSALQKDKDKGRLSDEKEKEIKEKFLSKLILAVNQPNRAKICDIIENEVNASDEVPYNYEELHELTLRWLESHEFGTITKEIIKKILEDIKNNRFTYQEIRNKNLDEQIKFAKSVVAREGTPTFVQFLDFLIKGEGKKYLEVLKNNGIQVASVSSILNKAGINAEKAFTEIYCLWFDEKGNKKQFLQTLEEEGVNLNKMSSILNGSGSNAATAFIELYVLWFDKQGNQTIYLKTLKNNGVNLTNMCSILNGAKGNAAKSYQELYNLWFDEQGRKTQYLKSLEDEGVNLASMSSILNGAGTNAAKSFKDLYELWFDTQGNKTQYLKTLQKQGVNLSSMSSILSGAGVKAPHAFEELYYVWFDVKGNKKQCLITLENEGISLANISSILTRTAIKAAKAFKDLYAVWFDLKGNKRKRLQTLQEAGISLTNISSILHGAAANAATSFKDLYDIWFDEEGNKKRHLKHFIKKKNEVKSFKIHNLSSILNGSRGNVKEAFEKLHNVCFTNKGKRTELLDDFYNAGFEPSNISCILCGTGIHASSILKRLHSVCFDGKGERTGLLVDFYDSGFRPSDLSNILSSAADSLKEFHYFCFIGETRKYFNHFKNDEESFTLSNLSDILHGSRTNLCSVFKDFHDVCFDESGNKTNILKDFYKSGFRSDDLSSILSMSGNNAPSILINFHKIYFPKDSYSNHFLADEELFNPKDLSRILRKVGMNIFHTFRKLHDLCFDDAGNRTDYLNNLIRNIPFNKVTNTLYERVRKGVNVAIRE